MATNVKNKFDDQITASDFSFNQKLKQRSDGTFGDKIRYRIDSKNPAQAYKALSRPAGVIDLTKSTSWSQSPTLSKEDLVSYTLKFHQPKYSSVLTNLFTNISQGLQIADQNLSDGVNFKEVRDGLDITNPYANMMIADDLKWTVKLPMLSLLPQTYTTSFGNGEGEGGNLFSALSNNITSYFANNSRSRGGVGNVIGSTIAGSGKLMGTIGRTIYPSVNASDSADRFYRGSSPIGYELNIDLLNTIDVETTKFNQEFVRFMAYQVSARSRNRYIEDSPIIAEAEIGGLRYAPLVKLDFEYTGVGNFLYIDGEPVPEAYQCRIMVKELLPSYRNLQHEYIHTGNKLRAINNDPDLLCKTIKEASSVIGGLVKRAF